MKEDLMKKLFTQRVLEVVYTIPEGTTLSYQEVARRAGNARASRAVGTIMKRNTNPLIPCHRVICSDGSLGGYNGGIDKKRVLLEAELMRVRTRLSSL
jgi:O-6-methylguanine DNA methyltransferase